MKYEDLDEYIQERWEGMIDLIEAKKLNDYALGRAMIKFSNSNNKLNKYSQKKGYEKADKYLKKQHDKKLAKMELIAEYVAGQLLTEVKKHGSEISNGEVTTNKNETSTVIKATIKPEIDGDAFSRKLTDYLSKCCDRGEISSYDFGFQEGGKFRCTLKITK